MMDIEANKAKYRDDFHAVNADIQSVQAQLKPLEDEINDLGNSDAPSKSRIREIRKAKEVIIVSSDLVEKSKYRSRLVNLLDGKTGVAP